MQVDHHGDREQAGVKMSNDCIVRIYRIIAPCHHITNTNTIAEQIQIQAQIHYEYKHILWPGFVWFVPHHMCKIVYVCGTLCTWILYLSVAHNVGPVVLLYISIFSISLQLNLWYSTEKWPLYCPQGSGTLRQQLLMMHGIAWYCMVLHCIA